MSEESKNAVSSSSPGGTVTKHRILGFRHRVKVKIVDGKPTEPLPSEMIVMDQEGKVIETYKLETEQAELDFRNGIFPTKYRVPDPSEDISGLHEWQIIWRSAKEGDILTDRHESLCKYKRVRAKGEQQAYDELVEVVKEVPCAWTGFEPGDYLIMNLGGSGDYFAASASVKLHEMGGEVYRLSPLHLMMHRVDRPKSEDAIVLGETFLSNPGPFYPTLLRDRIIITVRERYHVRTDSMKDRMACVQRLRQRFIGIIFCSDEGGYPQGDIEKQFDAMQANDTILQAITKQEEKANKAMEDAVEATDVWKNIFSHIEGVGPAITARLISAIIDIRRFPSREKLKRYLGVHVMDDGTFPRSRNGSGAKWQHDGRQALYLLGDQFVKRPKSEWGQKLNQYKEKLRTKHPEVCIQTKEHGLLPIGPAPQKKRVKYKVKHPVSGEEIEVSGKQKYGDGHIHKMAIWRTITKFTEWLYREWSKHEREMQKQALDKAA